MEMGKLTAKLRDAVPVCLIVEGKEIKRYRNIEIPDDIKKLEYQSFEFNVPANGNITFKISFAPGVLPEEFPQVRERRTRTPKEESAPVMNEAPAATPVEKATETAQESTAIIAIQDTPLEEVPETQAVGEDAASKVEVHASEETTPNAIIEPEAKEVDKKPTAKPKKVAASTGSK